MKRGAGKGVWTGRAESGVVDFKVDAPSTDGIKLEGSFSLPKRNYFVGEPIEMTFTVENKGDSAIDFTTGSDYRSTGRHDRFSIRAVDAESGPVPDPVTPSPFGGGLGGSVRIKPGESNRERLLVNHWCALVKPGKYKLTCQRVLNVIRSEKRGSDFYSQPESSLPAIPIETTFEIQVTDDPAALKDYLATFAPTLEEATANRQLPPGKQKRVPIGNIPEELECLSLMQIEAAFPVLTELLNNLDYQDWTVPRLVRYGSGRVAPLLLSHFPTFNHRAQESALRALSGWKTPGTDALLAEVLRDKDRDLRDCALSICGRQRYESCVPILLTMKKDLDPDSLPGWASALGTSGDPRAIPLLLNLLRVQDPRLQMFAAAALGDLKRMDGVPVLIGLLRNPRTRKSGYAFADVLAKITGQSPGENDLDWVRWWDETGRAEYRKR